MTLNDDLTYSSQLTNLVDSNYNCQKLYIFNDHIYVGCISNIDNNFQICSFNHIKNTFPECFHYKFNYELKNNQSIKNEQISFQLFISSDNQKHFIFCFKNSKLAPLKNKFFLISQNQNIIFEIPMKDFVIDDIRIVSFNSRKNSFQILMSRIKNASKDLINFKIDRMILDLVSLREGIVAEGISSYDVDKNKLVIFEYKVNVLYVNQYDLFNMSKKEYKIPGQVKLLKKDFNNSFIFVITEDLDKKSHIFLINTKSGRLFLFPVSYPIAFSEYTLIEINHQSYFWLFLHENKELDQKHSMFLIKLENFENISFSYDTKYFEKNPDKKISDFEIVEFNQSKIQTKIEFSLNNKFINTIIINYIKTDFIYNKINEEEIITNIEDTSSLYLPLKGNNLNFDATKNDIIYLNEIYISNLKLSEIFKNEEIFCYFEFKKFMVLTKEADLHIYSYKRILENNSTPFYLENVLKVEGLSNEILNDSYHVDAQFILSKFLVVLVNKRKLYYADLMDSYFTSTNVKFKEFNIDLEYDCSLDNDMMNCLDSLNPRMIISYKFEIFDEEISLSETVKDFDLIFYRNDSFFYSKYFKNKFISLVVKNNKVGIDFSFTDKHDDFYELEFLDSSNLSDLIYFQELFYKSYLIIHKISTNDFMIYLIMNKSIIHYPFKEYADQMLEHKGTYLSNGLPFFAFTYKTFNGKLKAIIYKNNYNLFERVVKVVDLDDEECSQNDIKIHFYNEKNNSFMVYFCKSTKNFKLFKITSEIYLEINSNQNNYEVALSNNMKQVNSFHFRKSEFNDFLDIELNDIILKENNDALDVYDLETHKNLEVVGNVVSCDLESNNDYITFTKRIDFVSLQKIQHEKKFLKNDSLSIMKNINHKDFTIVTNEYIINNSGIQNNNFYEDCVKPKIINTSNFAKLKTRNLYICKSIENQKITLTNFNDFKLEMDIIEKELVKPTLLKISNNYYLVFRTNKSRYLFIYKFVINSKNKDSLIFMWRNIIPTSIFDTFMHKLEIYHLKYMEKTNELALLIKNENTHKFWIISIILSENVINFNDFISFDIDNNESQIVSFSYCQDDANMNIICIGRSVNAYKVLKIFYKSGWKVHTLYDIPSFYKNNFLITNKMDYLDDEYLVILNKTHDIFQENKTKNMVIKLFKLNPETKSGHLFYSLNSSDFNMKTENLENLRLNDIRILKNDDDSNLNLIVLGNTFSTSNNSSSGFKPNFNLNIFKYSIGNFSLKYNVKAMNFRDSFDIKFYDYNGNKTQKKISMVIMKNAKLFIYLIIDCILFVVLVILLCVTCYIYRAKKYQKMEEMQTFSENENLEQSDDNDENSSSKSFII